MSIENKLSEYIENQETLNISLIQAEAAAQKLVDVARRQNNDITKTGTVSINEEQESGVVAVQGPPQGPSFGTSELPIALQHVDPSPRLL